MPAPCQVPVAGSLDEGMLYSAAERLPRNSPRIAPCRKHRATRKTNLMVRFMGQYLMVMWETTPNRYDVSELHAGFMAEVDVRTFQAAAPPR